MAKKNTRKNKQKLKLKKALPKLASDKDFLDAFLNESQGDLKEKKQGSKKTVEPEERLNKHGLPFLDNYESWMNNNLDPDTPDEDNSEDNGRQDPEPEVDFSALLEASLKKDHTPRHVPKPTPLKRRLKRYPPPEADLDLHGFNAIGARIKAQSYISSKHAQGFFTLRIIVGKGLHSETGPVLPDVVEDVLKEMKKENIVLSYEWEGGKKSKAGAVLVYLKRFND